MVPLPELFVDGIYGLDPADCFEAVKNHPVTVAYRGKKKGDRF
jgi:hypothetical protein